MAKPRIILADTDFSYIVPLLKKFVEDYFEKVDLEIITEESFFDETFYRPQTADILVVSNELYTSNLLRHNIAHIFVLNEQYGVASDNFNVTYLYKYSSVKELFYEITGKSADILQKGGETKKQPNIITFYSAGGGTGKTTLALGVAAVMAKNYKKVLYVNADRMQKFQYLLEDKSVITSMELYAKLGMAADSIFPEIKKVIRTEGFDYLPPFKAPLMSLGVDYSVYRKIVEAARNSGEYDYVVVDADTVFDEEKADLLNSSDKVVIVTRQDGAAVFTTNVLAANLNRRDSDKYLFVCNDYKEEQQTGMGPVVEKNYSIGEYVEHVETYEELKPRVFAEKNGTVRTAFLIM